MTTDARSDVSGKVLFITGAASGIGAACARAAGERGYRVAVVDIDEAAAQEVAAELGAAAVALALDVRVPAQWDAALDAAWQHFGVVDVLLNNAGIIHTGYARTLELPEHRDMMDVNFFGPVTGMKAVLPRFREQGHGHVVNICSMTAFLPLTGYATYCATKHALRAFHHSLALEERDGPVAFTIIHPPAVRTPMLDQELADDSAFMGFAERSIAPEKLARAVVVAIEKRPVELVFPPVMGQVQRATGALPGVMRRAIPIAERVARRARQRLLAEGGRRGSGNARERE